MVTREQALENARMFGRVAREALELPATALNRWAAEMADLDERILRLQAVGEITAKEAKKLRRTFPATKRIVVPELERQRDRRLGLR